MLRDRYPRNPVDSMEKFPEPKLEEIKCDVYGVEQMVKGWMYDLTEY